MIATLNLNGDYVSDALAAQVGGIGIAPGANISDSYAVFEATHGTAPKYAGQDKVNPGSLILSAEMMLRHLGWFEAADLVIKSMEQAIADKQVTYDFARLMEGANEISCSAFGDVMIARMDIRSYVLNYEINAVIYDEETTEELENLFFEDLKNSTRVTEDYFNNISPLTKAFEAFCRMFSSLL